MTPPALPTDAPPPAPPLPIGPKIIPHRKNAAEWAMYFAIAPAVFVFGLWSRTTGRGRRSAESPK